MIQLLKKLSWKQSRSCVTFGEKKIAMCWRVKVSVMLPTRNRDVHLNRFTTHRCTGGKSCYGFNGPLWPMEKHCIFWMKGLWNSRSFFWWKFVPEGWSVFFLGVCCWFLSRCCFVVLKDFSRLLGFRATNLGTHVSGAKSIALALERVGEKRCAAVFLQTWVMQIHHATDRSLAMLKKAQEIAHNITNNITKHHFFPHFLLAFFVEICLFFKSFVFFYPDLLRPNRLRGAAGSFTDDEVEVEWSRVKSIIFLYGILWIFMSPPWGIIYANYGSN